MQIANYVTPVVPNLFCSRAIYYFFGGHGGHKVNFVYIPIPSSPLPSNS